MPRPDTPWIASSLDDLIAGASERQSLQPEDARSGASFERLVIDGEPCFLKVLSHESDWIMRVTGNLDHWEFKVWRAGVYQRMPPVIDHAIIGMALDRSEPHPRLAILMHDRAEAMVPPGDDVLPLHQHQSLVEHMAALHAALWGWEDDLGLCSLESRLLFFAPAVIAPEVEVDDVPGAIRAADEGWHLLPERAPKLAATVSGFHRDPRPVVDELQTTPATFLPGDWKLGNLGSNPDGRTVLLDCAYPGSGPPCWDLAWYLALNRARLPMSKDETIAMYRDALERHGIDTTGWWERQLALCMVGIMVTFAWEKALGDADELEWWADRVEQSLALVG